MEFSIKNINKVKEANIKLNGLTVIAGENDSGKSTIGKMLFAAIKSLVSTDRNVTSKKQILLNKYVDSLYKRTLSLRTEGSFPPSSRDFTKKLMSFSDEKSMNDFLIEKKTAIEKMDVVPRIKSYLLGDLNNIMICVKEKNNRAADIATEIQYLIESEFINKICSHNTSSSVVEFRMNDDKKNRLHFEIISENVDSATVTNGDFIKDVTYIESPLYIHLLDALLRATSFRESSIFRPMVPSHIEDMMNKINDLRLVKDNVASSNDILEAIEKITNGHFVFDSKRKNLSFEKDGMSLSPINVASGIKSFGLIQMLLELDAINPNKMLIWDEPENHLHPQWQVEFANILVQLAKSGIPIVISTHSPYFIQGIRYFSAKQSIGKYVNYYFGETCAEDGMSVFTDVSDDLNRIFVKLAEPLNNIINID